MSPSSLESVLARDRFLVVAALCAVVAAAWLYLLAGAGMGHAGMTGMDAIEMQPRWSAGYFSVMAVMWAVMMAAMMLPSAAPMVLLHASIQRRRASTGRTLPATAIFVLGYVAIWTLFSLAATGLQWGLTEAALLSPDMRTTSKALAGALFIGAGVYQWTPLKQACLRRCRSPLDFIMVYWREGALGSFIMGLRHGMFCLGCCWLLMLLLFVGGLMNLAWVAGIAAFVLVEKLAPAGHWIGRAAGVLLIAWGTFALARL